MAHRAGLMVLAMTLLPASSAFAKPAQCFTTDEGRYSCNFKAIDRQGSFEITAKGYPKATLTVDSPGVAFVVLTIDGKSIPLPGEYYRSQSDGACWENPELNVQICAW